MRALDYLITLPFVDSKNVRVTGLSMEGEIATIVGALDTRVSIVVASGWSPDTGVFCNTDISEVNGFTPIIENI
jgi:cephalosporin-C deacetylase-like acetyl esterase